MGIDKGIIGGVSSMMASRFTPWHFSYNEDRVRLTDIDIENAHQALVMAGLDWKVNKVSLAEFMPDNVGAEDFNLNLRSDNGAVLGVHKTRYAVIDNNVVADLAEAVTVAAPGSVIRSAGALYEPGKVIWMLVELPEAGITFASGEHHGKYILVSTSHDGSLSLTVRGTRVRVECMNTMSMALSGSRADYVIRHTTNALDYVEEARRGIGVATKNSQAWDEQIARLIDTELDSADFMVDVVPAIIGDKPEDEGRARTMWDSRFAGIVEAYNADHNEAIVDTAWGAVNAVNEYEEWGITPRGREVWEAQFSRLLSGTYELTSKALSLVG